MARSLKVKPSMSVMESLGTLFPPLRTYWPNLGTCSPKQAAFLLAREREAFFGGAAGPGKSDALLAGALQYVDVPGYSALILRRTYADLALPGAIMARAKEWLYGRAHWNDKTYTFTFPGNATITFGYLESDNDVYRYQGSEFQYVAFDELTQFSEEQYIYLFSRQRATSDIGVPIRMRSASNPGGIGHGWVKDRFIQRRAAGTLFIPAKLEDHPDEKFKADYRLSLSYLGDFRRKQYEDGDWDAAAGMAYPDVLEGVHIVPKFELPDHWGRFESMDHGTTAPTAWILYAVDTDGNIIVSDMYYQANTLPDEDASAILKRRLDWWERKDSQGWRVTHPCYGDPSSLRERLATRDDFGQPMTLQDLYMKYGVRIIPANNRRRVGYVAVLQAFKQDPQRRFPLWHPRAGEYGAPRLFIFGDRCHELVGQLLAAPLADGENDPESGEAVDQKWERHYGHAHAALRYGLTTFTNPSAELPDREPETPEEIRAAYLKRQQDHFRDKSATRQDQWEDEANYWGSTG